MDKLKKLAIEVKDLYDQLNIQNKNAKWGLREKTEGLVIDVADLLKLVMQKLKLRSYKGENIDEDIKHELSDCLWAIIVIADELNVDIEKEFFNKIGELKTKIKTQIKD